MVSVGQTFGCSSAVWFGPGASGEVAIRQWLWFRSRQRLVCAHVWGREETLVQLGNGIEGTSWTSLSTPMESFHVTSPARWHQGPQTCSLLGLLRALKVRVTREKELEAAVLCVV